MEKMAALKIVVIQSFLGVTCIAGTHNAESGSTPCKTLADRVSNSGLIGSYVPSCAPDGFYAALQCHGSTGVCWCSDKHGQPLSKEDWKSTDCGNPCYKKILDNPAPTILIRGAPNILKTDIGAPICDNHGFFVPKQCHKSLCWCVDKIGSRITKSSSEELSCE